MLRIMHTVSEKRLKELQDLLEEEFGEPVSLEETRVIANNLFRLCEIVLQSNQSDKGSAA